jgi:RHS repeat-associated protein
MLTSNYTFLYPKNYLYSQPVKGLRSYEVGYRFGFNGKEKDDETYGKGNAYDFGARIYDSRLGRWLACDPSTKEQPFASPYKSMGNNPLIFSDPDGKKEFITTIIRDEKTGKQTMCRVEGANNIMTDGVIHPTSNENVNSLIYDNEVRYYDFETVVTFTKGIDGKLTPVGGPQTSIIKDNVRDTEGFNDIEDKDKKGTVKRDWNDFEGPGGYQKGGFHFYSKFGAGASPTKWKATAESDVTEMEVGDALMAFTALKGLSLPSINGVLGTSEYIGVLKDLKELKTSIDNTSPKTYCPNCSTPGNYIAPHGTDTILKDDEGKIIKDTRNKN